MLTTEGGLAVLRGGAEWPTGLVYFVKTDKVKIVKIGYTQDWASRRRKLEAGCPHDLLPLAVVVGTLDSEAGLHAVFSRYRRNHEWFNYTGELFDFVQAVKREFKQTRDVLYGRTRQIPIGCHGRII